ncbi:MAG: hypothetical protein CMM56_02245 [Rhodospirillaceae bacterium]|nr:hypothetical protein [Rhodospirillaceae bacterium]
MSQRNLIAGIVLTGLGIFFGVLTMRLPSPSTTGSPSPAFFPFVITIIWLALSLTLSVTGFLGILSEPKEPKRENTSKKTWITLSAFLTYLLILPLIGFLLTSIFFFSGLMWLYGEKNANKIIFTSICIPLIIFYVFANGLEILLPSGTW